MRASIHLRLLLRLAGLALALPLAPVCARAASRDQPPVKPATDYPAVEVHASEHVAIAADPYDTRGKEKLFHVDYMKYGVVPVRLIVTNLGDRPISLGDARILFETSSGELVQAAEPADIERLMNPHEPRSIPAPSPFPPIPGLHFPHKNYNKEIEADFNRFEYQALVVEPHSTRAGFLFYVLTGLADPLAGAHLSITRLRNADGKELFYFEIPFDKYLKAEASGAH